MLNHREAFLTLHWAQSEQSKHYADSPLEQKWSRRVRSDGKVSVELTVLPREPAAALPGRDLNKMLLFHFCLYGSALTH